MGYFSINDKITEWVKNICLQYGITGFKLKEGPMQMVLLLLHDVKHREVMQ